METGVYWSKIYEKQIEFMGLDTYYIEIEKKLNGEGNMYPTYFFQIQKNKKKGGVSWVNYEMLHYLH